MESTDRKQDAPVDQQQRDLIDWIYNETGFVFDERRPLATALELDNLAYIQRNLLEQLQKLTELIKLVSRLKAEEEERASGAGVCDSP